MDRKSGHTQKGFIYSMYNKKFDKLIPITHDPENPNSLSYTKVKSFLIDNTNYVWLGTMHGLNKYIPNARKFEHYKQEPGKKNTLPGNSIYTFCEDSLGNLWIGTTNSGLSKFNKTTKIYTNYKNTPTDKNSIPLNWISQIIYTSNGELWLSTLGNGISRYNYIEDNFTNFSFAEKISTDRFTTMEEVPDKKLYLSSGIGLIVWDPLKLKIDTIYLNNKTQNSLSHNHTFCTMLDSKNNLWIPTLFGIDILNLNNKSFNHIYFKNHKIFRDSTYRIDQIFEDSNSTIWIDVKNLGLVKLNYEFLKFKAYTTQNGLPNNTIYRIEEDKNHNLWISTNKGLSKFNPKTEIFTNFDITDGLQSNEFNTNASYKSKNGKMYFGGVNGYNAFYPENIQLDTIIPKVIITKFQIYGETVKILPYNKIHLYDPDNENSIIKDDKNHYLPKDIAYTNKIVLSWYDKVLTFQFAGLHFSFPEQNTYKYKLEGFNDEWINIGTRRFVNFTNLEPGKYILKILAANSDGVWSKTPTKIKLIITPPFWKTIWFDIIVIIIIVVTIVTFIKVRERNLKRQKRILEQKVKERTAEVVAQKQEILEKNEELQQQNEEILAQRDEIEIQKTKIEVHRDTLVAQNEQIDDILIIGIKI